MLYIKQYKYADKDIKKLTGSIVVLVDTREKQNRHITDYFDKNNIAYEPATLSYGDYSFYILADVAGESIYFYRDIVIERKSSLEELSGNLAQEREIRERISKSRERQGIKRKLCKYAGSQAGGTPESGKQGGMKNFSSKNKKPIGRKTRLKVMQGTKNYSQERKRGNLL